MLGATPDHYSKERARQPFPPIAAVQMQQMMVTETPTKKTAILAIVSEQKNAPENSNETAWRRELPKHH